MLPGFHLQTLRRKPRSEQQKFAEKIALLKQKSFKQIGEVFEQFIPSTLLQPAPKGSMFSKENTFWAFLSQVLDADGGCKEVIRKLQSYASIKGLKVPSSSTASYCTARAKLEEQTLSDIFAHTADSLETIPETGTLNNRRVIVVDGTGVTMPDTPENQGSWPQPSSQKPGCGFPSARICGCFSLASGALLSYAVGNRATSCCISGNSGRPSSRATSSWATRDFAAISIRPYSRKRGATVSSPSPEEHRSGPQKAAKYSDPMIC